MWERNNREEEEEQVDIMTEGREKGKTLCFGNDSRKMKDREKIPKRVNANLRGRKSRFNTSQKQGMAGGSSTDLEEKL